MAGRIERGFRALAVATTIAASATACETVVWSPNNGGVKDCREFDSNYFYVDENPEATQIPRLTEAQSRGVRDKIAAASVTLMSYDPDTREPTIASGVLVRAGTKHPNQIAVIGTAGHNFARKEPGEMASGISFISDSDRRGFNCFKVRQRNGLLPVTYTTDDKISSGWPASSGDIVAPSLYDVLTVLPGVLESDPNFQILFGGAALPFHKGPIEDELLLRVPTNPLSPNQIIIEEKIGYSKDMPYSQQDGMLITRSQDPEIIGGGEGDSGSAICLLEVDQDGVPLLDANGIPIVTVAGFLTGTELDVSDARVSHFWSTSEFYPVESAFDLVDT